MSFRTTVAVVAMMMMATACEQAFENASGGIEQGSVDTTETDATSRPAEPGADDGSSEAPTPPAAGPVPTLPPPDAGPAADDDSTTGFAGAEIVFEEDGHRGGHGPLDEATVGRPFSVRLSLDEATIVPSRVTWMIDGQTYRDDDLDSPYTLRYNDRPLPVNRALRSDQGLDGSWRLDRGSTHEISAVVEHPGGEMTLTAGFVIGGRGGGGPSGRPAPESAPPTTAPTTTTAPVTTTTLASVPTVGPTGGDGWPSPPPVDGRQTVTSSDHWALDYRDLGSPWHIHDVDIVANGGNGVGPANVGAGGMMENASVVVNAGGDNIKIAPGGVYRNLYLRMSVTGGHTDAMQAQGDSDFLIQNVVIEIPEPSPTVTGAILVENMCGGGAGYRDVVGTIDRLKLIGTGPYNYDLRLQNNPVATMTMTFTNIDWSDAHPDSVLLLKGTPETLTVYVDDSVPDSRIKGAENATVIRI